MKKSLVRCFTALVLFCVYFSSLQLSHGAVLRSADEVFCPLQKTWVKRTPSAIPAAILAARQKEPLKDICARVERKEVFLFELTESLRFTRATPSDRETEKLFFSYSAKGKPALALYVFSQNAPEPQYISSARTEKSANNTRFEFAAQAVRAIASKLPPRFIRVAANDFASSASVQLKNISRSISPRAPPAFALSV